MSSTVTLDDVSPLIQYSGPWRAGTASDDPYFNSYSNNGTFTLTNRNGAAATIKWHGTGIQVFGAKRDNHGDYSVSLNGNKPRFASGNSFFPEFSASLFHVQGLADGLHTLVIENAPQTNDPDQSYLDIDYITLETTQAPGDHSVTIEDFEPSVQYAPAVNDWNTHSELASTIQGSSFHVTTKQNATATFYFSGSSVDLYGMICPSCGSYSVSVDGGAEDVFTSKNIAHTLGNQVLYVARGLSEGGVHNLRVTNLDDGGALGIDHALVSGLSPGGITPPATTSSSGTGTPSSQAASGAGAGQTSTSPASDTAGAPSGHHKFPVVEVVSAILGCLLLILAVVIFVLLRQRKKQRRRRRGPANLDTDDSESIMSPVSPGALASPFMMPTSPARSLAFSNIDILLRAPTPASLRSASPIPYARSRHSFAASEMMSSAHSGSGSGLPYDQETLMLGSDYSVSPRAPTPALVLHEAPPAYDTTSRPPSVLLLGDKKM
ncbi:hypothetical protein EXIGLDRAFT_664123 [Exidia glandulosa HHB12029]|uniref:Transmembrane protein n=1 Tax=Exidia glandulosa HHB12029 TaxID=1314781 RepID=A0A165QFB9_EXIGL|nr:hypothetical protein EXIGLDRAFT_664123 [Exidia glandulosa HHB12029]